MRTIWKYKVEPGMFTRMMPSEARVMDVQLQGKEPVMWAFIPNDDAPKIERTFVTYGTGHQVNQQNLKYLGSFQPAEGLMPIVFHLFEVVPYPSASLSAREALLP